MSNDMSASLRVVLHEGAGFRPLAADRRYEIIKGLLQNGYAVTSPKAGGAVAPADSSDVLVLGEAEGDAMEQEATAWEAGGIAAQTDVQVHFRDLKGVDAADVSPFVDDLQKSTETYKNPGWKPWFPVIDFDLCTNCMQCLSFCLFDVYGVDSGQQITVKNEEKCKTNCPACSRVCPEVAILFPKYGAGPINGDVVQKEDIDREKMKVDISALLGGDIYSLLRDRHAKASSRFSKERDEDRALKERMRCLKKLQKELDVPDEVLMALPSQDQIMRKAREKAAARSDDSDPAKESRDE